MRKKVLLIAIATMLAVQSNAQKNYKNPQNHQFLTTLCNNEGMESNNLKNNSGYFTRGQGFVIRPELYRGLLSIRR